jgi:hypothetical protein
MPKLTLTFKGQALSVHHLEDGSTLIGRDPECGIHIDSLAVAPCHVELTTFGEQCQMLALDPEYPAYVNEAPVTEATLEHGDLLRVGKHTLRFASDGVPMGRHVDEDPTSADAVPAPPPVPGPAKGSAYIQILSGEHIGRIIPLNRNMVRIGRAGGDCAMIAHRAGGYFLSHLEGSMATLDGVPIGGESVLLTDGSTIEIGTARLQFYL